MHIMARTSEINKEFAGDQHLGNSVQVREQHREAKARHGDVIDQGGSGTASLNSNHRLTTTARTADLSKPPIYNIPPSTLRTFSLS